MFEFKMPSLGADMTEGTLLCWNVGVGDHIHRGEIICEVETAKGAIEVEFWESGVIRELMIQPGDQVPVGETIALVQLDASSAGPDDSAIKDREDLPADPPDSRVTTSTPEQQESATDDSPPDDAAPAPKEPLSAPAPASRGQGDRIMASPAARKLARERGVDISKISGTGFDGAVTLADIEAAQIVDRAQQAPAHKRRITPLAKKVAEVHAVDLDQVQGHGAHGAVERADVEEYVARSGGQKAPATSPPRQQTNMRAAIAAAMSKSKREIPHYYLREDISMQRAMNWLATHNASVPVSERLLPAVLLIKAVALAAGDVPEVNGHFEAGEFDPKEASHVGFAIALKGDGGVISPALLSAETRSLQDLMKDLKDLVGRARKGKLRSSEITDATITITSLGELGVEAVYGVINPPQVAIVGFGRIADRIVAKDGLIGVQPGVTATLSGDHRVSDGITGARFLARVRDLLQTPEQL